MADKLHQDAETAIRDCENYMGLVERNGIVALTGAMAVALRLLLAIYLRPGRANG